VLRITDLTLARGALRLLEGASLTVHAGHRVGVVGPNGSGKSSLFALLRGDLLPEAGRVDLPPRWTIAHVAQETPSTDRAAIDFVLDGDTRLRELEAAIAREEREHAADGHLIAELHQHYETIGGYASRARAAELLAGLGVAEARHGDPVASFSGGWRMRLNLAQALAARSDLLLLDEPTNHLDLDAVLWLEDWLRRYPGTLVIVTHDRDFLDAVAQSIVHVTGRKLVHYAGNYSAFERERAAQLALQQAAYARQQRQIAHLQSFVDRFRAKATKAKQAQSRLKTLEKMERIAPAHVDSPFEFAFAPAGTHARTLVRLGDATLRYGEAKPVFEGLELSVLAGDRIGLLGANGAGKSTLAKALAGTLPLAAGERHVAQNLAIGTFAQHQMEQLDPDASPMLHLQRIDPSARDQDLRNFLGGFDFRGDMADAPIARFSGGEKARLVLAMIVRRRPQILILDEPTNHLDIEMREALAEALQAYDGALVVVAHDRHLLTATTDTLLLVDAGRVAPFDGDLDDYRDWVLSRRRREAAAAPSASEALPGRKATRRAQAEARQQRSLARKPLLAEQARLEGEIRALEQEKTAVDGWLATPEAYADDAKDRLKPAIERSGEITWELARREARWLEIAEALEALGSEP